MAIRSSMIRTRCAALWASCRTVSASTRTWMSWNTSTSSRGPTDFRGTSGETPSSASWFSPSCGSWRTNRSRPSRKGCRNGWRWGERLIHDPSVLVLDEPAAGLDPRARIELRGLIHVLATELHKTVLISSHILTELGEICDSAAIIEAGRLLASGTMTEINQAQRASEGRADGSAISVRVLRDAEKLEHLLCQEPLVRNVELADRVATFEFTGVESELSAILKRLVRAELEVVEFRGRVDSLEDAFMAITKGITQ